jgi:hypothetical protein
LRKKVRETREARPELIGRRDIPSVMHHQSGATTGVRRGAR